MELFLRRTRIRRNCPRFERTQPRFRHIVHDFAAETFKALRRETWQAPPFGTDELIDECADGSLKFGLSFLNFFCRSRPAARLPLPHLPIQSRPTTVLIRRRPQPSQLQIATSRREISVPGRFGGTPAHTEVVVLELPALPPFSPSTREFQGPEEPPQVFDSQKPCCAPADFRLRESAAAFGLENDQSSIG